MDVQQENQPERQADARLTQPSFVTIFSSPFTSQIIKAIENDRRSENGACDGHGWQRHRTEFSAPSNPISVVPVRGSRYPDRRAWLSPPALPTRNDAASDACSCPCHRALVRICGLAFDYVERRTAHEILWFTFNRVVSPKVLSHDADMHVRRDVGQTPRDPRGVHLATMQCHDNVHQFPD